MAKANEEAAPGAIAVVRYDIKRADKQWHTTLYSAAFCAAVLGISAYFAVWGLVIFFGVILAIVVGVGLLLRSQGGTIQVSLAPEGLWVASLQQVVTWPEIRSMSAWIFDNSVGSRSLGSSIVKALFRRGGINDGSKTINIVLHNPLLFKEKLGSERDFYVSDSLPNEEPATPGTVVNVSSAATRAEFATFVTTLGDEAHKHGIPVRWNWNS